MPPTEAFKTDSIRNSSTYVNTQFGGIHFESFIGSPGLDIGFRGAIAKTPPMWSLTGVDLDYPGYDGLHLPFGDETQLTVHASHVLEHCVSPRKNIVEWFRVLRPDGHLIITVPHRDLYEKRKTLPSRFNGDHKRFYTPARLLVEIELALVPNHWRLIYCRDNDWEFDYTRGPLVHSSGCYEIECVVKKIKPPYWEIR